MKKEFGDNILIGASSSEHLDSNLKDLEKGPLPEEVVEALDKGWELVKGVASNVSEVFFLLGCEVGEEN